MIPNRNNILLHTTGSSCRMLLLYFTQTTDYYPYGLPMATSTGQEQNRYKYSGKEFETRRGLNFHDFEARMLFSDRALFNRPDPMAQDYPHLSPYSYCAGNPIRYIDPTGEDIWRINGKGEVVEHTVTEDFDKFEFVDKDKNIIKNAQGEEQVLQFEYGTVINHRKVDYKEFTKANGEKIEAGKADVFEIRGDDSATRLFEMFSQNVTGRTFNEVSQVKTGVEGDKGLNFISSGHVIGSEPGMSRLYNTQLVNGYNIREMIHSHPRSDYAGNNDMIVKSQVIGNSINNKVRIPIFKYYLVTSHKYNRY